MVNPQQPDLSKSRVPELALMGNRSRAESLELDNVDDDIVKFLEPIKNSKVIDIMGGLGMVAEHLSATGNSVKLLEELRMFFVYRRQLFPKSKVVEMNIHPNSIKASEKLYYDYAIIHSNEFLDFAQKIATTVYNVSTKEIYEKVPVNSIEKLPEVSEDNTSQQTTEEYTSDTDINIPSKQQPQKFSPIGTGISG